MKKLIILSALMIISLSAFAGPCSDSFSAFDVNGDDF